MVVEFWYDFASTYSYPAAMRIEALAAATGVTLDWRPFLLGPLFQRQGWNDSPFNVNPARGRYMWRDLERICGRHALPFRRPSVFPRRSLLAARLGGMEALAPALPEFTRAVYQANFARDLDIDDPAVVGPILAGLGLNATALIRRASDADIKEALRARTEEAWERGIVGAPSFLVGGEIFWGQDRIEEALAWAGARGGGPRGSPAARVQAPAAADRAGELIERLGLRPHPEGGHYREFFRTGARVATADGRGERTGLTVIHFLLRRGEHSRWHRVRSDETWQLEDGDGLDLLLLPADLARVERVWLAPAGAGGRPAHVVPAGFWQAARPLGAHALAACAVGPGFEFADFTLLADDAAAAKAVRDCFAEWADLI
jgi:2-hydroxychromene-2-carboxylate isomerase/predicted cupin superfamily sugar epimerase